jgi:hypothetical protein
MNNRLKKLAPLLTFDAVLGLLFIVSNISIWSLINSEVMQFGLWDVYIKTFNINPLQIAVSYMELSNGNVLSPSVGPTITNYPFILFWILLLGNIGFVVRMLQKAQKNPYMLRRLVLLLIFDALASSLFVFSNISIWNTINSEVMQFNSTDIWIKTFNINPLQFAVRYLGTEDHFWTSRGVGPTIPNYPFILFWVILLGNIGFVIWGITNSTEESAANKAVIRESVNG